jgi:copper chaperone CopZ
MQIESFDVANIKCGGCASTIVEGLQKMAGIQDVQVDIAEGRVKVTGAGLTRQLLQNKLAELGYPVR